MLSLIARTLIADPQEAEILEVAYELYLQAPEDSHPLISLKALSRVTGASPLVCRNAIVTANQQGRFPNCSLAS
jgi:hypothetical protein